MSVLSSTQSPASTGGVPPSSAAGRVRVPRWRRRLRPYLLIVPAVALCVGILYPFLLGVFYTLFNYSATKPVPDFVGVDNYVTVLTQGEFWHSAWVTGLFAVLATVVETVLGVGVALLLNRSSLLGRLLEKVLIVPLMIAPIIAAIIWKLMLWPSVGVLSHYLSMIGLGDLTAIDTAGKAMFWCVVIDTWIFTPFVAILALAALRSMPRSPFEAAAVDGASPWFTFRTLTLPMLWPYVLVAVIFRFMDSLKVFDVIYAFTQGGPGNATTTLQISAYLQAITYQRYSFGTTFMIVLWAIVYVVSMVLVRYLGRVQNRSAGK
ncbi:carbohydrate ABC transporter permease [Goodfellowiella coeruleoviolacea]|uniref:Multiple sugar transport system permease protein n=1 Tax=Goodfellowiella coeruleoviolacea TaxID=334858 RepID=A0AAE3GAI2_9PSEU|nr:sugar ABC transporter permease [Goodfellowiella coeruleoviolacea]MCP2164530.1 multiple sugar transport system permease protein [Goodfellowiella coeruleoviolacea]